MLSFQIASDLHIEFNDNENIDPLNYIIPIAEIMILAGDIGSLYKINQLHNFITKLAVYFKYVIYVPGNNEYYMQKNYNVKTMKQLKNTMNYIKNTISNLYILNNNSIIIDDICIVGTTLWSKPNYPIPPFIVRIHDINTRIYNNNHTEAVKYIKYMIKYSKNHKYKLLVVTHYPPTYKILTENHNRRKFVSLYASNLDYLLEKNGIHTWIYGHTHKNYDIMINNCRLVSNQKGKIKDKITDYSNNFTIQI